MKFSALLSSGLLLLGLAAPVVAQTPTGVWVHADSLTEAPKYAEGFSHFDYVNPDAPEGGTVRLSANADVVAALFEEEQDGQPIGE